MAQRLSDMAPDIDDHFTGLECDLLEGAFLASRWDPLNFVYVPPYQGLCTRQFELPNVVAVKHFNIHSNQECVEDGVLSRVEMRKRWFILRGYAREAVEKLWNALHAAEPEPAVPKGLWSRPSTHKPSRIAEIINAREDVQREVPLFCHNCAEQLLTYLEMMTREQLE